MQSLNNKDLRTKLFMCCLGNLFFIRIKESYTYRIIKARDERALSPDWSNFTFLITHKTKVVILVSKLYPGQISF